MIIHSKIRNYYYIFLGAERTNFKAAIKFLKWAIYKCNKHNLNKLLIEQDITNTFSMVQIFLLIETISKMYVHHIKIAFVDRNSKQKNINNFAELAARNRGVSGRIFTDLDKAEKWLVLKLL